jgi:hypothetical protein
MLLRYCVDRGKSVRVLEAFLEKKDVLLATEKQWLLDIHATAVLSDAAFLGWYVQLDTEPNLVNRSTIVRQLSSPGCLLS